MKFRYIDRVDGLLKYGDDEETLPLCEHFAQITAMNPTQTRPLEATITYKGKQFPQKCFVTQDLVDAYQAGKLKVGDWVVVHFTENMPDRPIATQKVYKTW